MGPSDVGGPADFGVISEYDTVLVSMHRFGFFKDSSRQCHQLEGLTTKLGGVGIVFVQAPDKSLFVKSIIPNSSAWQSGVEIGDCLMKASRVTYTILKTSPDI